VVDAYHIRFKQQAAKNLLNEPVSRACLERVDATVSVRILSISTVQHLDLELLMLSPIVLMMVLKDDEVAVDADVVLDKAPPRMVKTALFAWC
jgi:hypothetical protein